LGQLARLAAAEAMMNATERFFIALAIVGLIGLALTVGMSSYF